MQNQFYYLQSSFIVWRYWWFYAGRSSLSVGVIASAAAGGLVVITISALLLLIVCYFRCRRSAKSNFVPKPRAARSENISTGRSLSYGTQLATVPASLMPHNREIEAAKPEPDEPVHYGLAAVKIQSPYQHLVWPDKSPYGLSAVPVQSTYQTLIWHQYIEVIRWYFLVFHQHRLKYPAKIYFVSACLKIRNKIIKKRSSSSWTRLVYRS